MLVSGPDGPSYVDSREFPEADLSDCDDAPELSVGSLGDVGRGSAQGLRGYGSTHLRAGIRSGRGWTGWWLAASYHVPPMSSSQRLPSSVSEPAPLDPLLVSPQVFSCVQTFASFFGPFGLGGSVLCLVFRLLAPLEVINCPSPPCVDSSLSLRLGLQFYCHILFARVM